MGTIPSQVREGLLLLLRAHDYADDLARDVWDFGVEIGSLRRLGLTNVDFRWLLHKGYLEHAREIALRGAGQREFHECACVKFAKGSCFVLTQAGVSFARELREKTGVCEDAQPSEPASEEQSLDRPPLENRLNGPVPVQAQVPVWDRDRHELRLGHVVVKVFKLPSPNQETILAAFDEEGWPPRIDDPLPTRPGVVAKRRLHDTIKSLNRTQKSRLIHFMGDGSGEGIRWELVSRDAKKRYRQDGPHSD